mgnify:FL=1
MFSIGIVYTYEKKAYTNGVVDAHIRIVSAPTYERCLTDARAIEKTLADNAEPSDYFSFFIKLEDVKGVDNA